MTVIPGTNHEYFALDNGDIFSSISNRVLKPSRKKEGYLGYTLIIKGKKWYPLGHTLVMLAHAGPRKRGFCINHKNGNKADNRIENLEYVTWSQNSQHSYDNGLSKNSRHIPEDLIIDVICGLLEGCSEMGLHKKYKITRQSVRRIHQHIR